MVLQLNETCRVSQASCWERRHQPDARSENDTKCLHLLFYCSNLDNLSLCVYNQWYHWPVVDMNVVTSAVTKGIFKSSGIQINKTLKKSTHLAPHMLLRVHCDVAAYGQKYVCFVTILMCMTPMTGWNNYAKYKATWTHLRNCEVAWPKSRGHFAKIHNIAAEDKRHRQRHGINKPLNAVKHISQISEDGQTQSSSKSSPSSYLSFALETEPCRVMLFPLYRCLSLARRSGSTHSHAVTMTIGSGLLASSPSSSSLNAEWGERERERERERETLYKHQILRDTGKFTVLLVKHSYMPSHKSESTMKWNFNKIHCNLYYIINHTSPVWISNYSDYHMGCINVDTVIS